MADSLAKDTHPAALPHWTHDPSAWVAGLVGVQVLVWTLVPWLAGTSLPLDVVSDGLAWGHEWQWGYFKHPPLPAWEVEAFFDALGDVGPFLLSQIAIGLTYLFVFLTGRLLMPAKWAAAGTLLAACVYFFSVPTPEFNHNVAQMPLWAAIAFTYLKALRTRKPGWWIALGVASGLALLTKYAAGILLATVTIHLFAVGERRVLLRTAGPWLALLVCALVTAPHMAWLVQHHFPTIAYAARRAGQTSAISRVIAPVRFLLSQLLDISPALVAAALAGLLGRESFRRDHPDENLRFLLSFTLGPALLTALLSLVAGLGLRDMWGAPMWNLTGLLIVYAGRERWPAASLPRLGACVAAVFVLCPLAYVLSTATVPALRARPSRTQWPDRAMAARFDAAFLKTTGRPVYIIAADGWLGGLVAMRSDPRPSVFTDGSFAEAPWITPERLAGQGALVLWRADRPVPRTLLQLPAMRQMGKVDFAWPGISGAKPLAIGWGIMSPRSGNDRKGPP